MGPSSDVPDRVTGDAKNTVAPDVSPTCSKSCQNRSTAIVLLYQQLRCSMYWGLAKRAGGVKAKEAGIREASVQGSIEDGRMRLALLRFC